MKWLLVGDTHIRPQDLEEGQRLVSFVKKTIHDNNIDCCVFMGDQSHYHDLAHNSVLSFWNDTFRDITNECSHVFALKGNHDYEKGRIPHSMMYFKSIENLTIVDAPLVFDGKLFLPHMPNNDFVNVCKRHSNIKTVLVHQDFNGAMYENGFFASNGVNPEEIPQESIIGGHIHLTQKVGKLLLVGSPRWLTVSDENKDKYIWITDFKGQLDKIDTRSVCSPIWRFELHEGKDLVIPSNLGIEPRVTVDVHGTVDFIASIRNNYEKFGFKVRSFPPKKYTVKVRESEGLVFSFNSFLDGYKSPNGTTVGRMREIVKDRIKWDMTN
jgi:DNA repair exonuclease SbcCD nuclease subunit